MEAVTSSRHRLIATAQQSQQRACMRCCTRVGCGTGSGTAQVRHSLKQGVCIAALRAMWALALASVGADAAAVVEALWVTPASALVVVRIRAGSPCMTQNSITRQQLSVDIPSCASLNTRRGKHTPDGSTCIRHCMLHSALGLLQIPTAQGSARRHQS